MTTQIDKARAVELLREIVAEHGKDFVYKFGPAGCTYTHRGRPSCLVGHVLHRAGVPIEHLAVLDFDLTGSLSIQLESVDWGVDIAFEARGVLAVAQDAQDDGKPWGVALSRAEDEAGAL